MSDKVIPLSVPNISGNEWKYVKDCLDTGWISSAGSYVTQFEHMVADYVGAQHGVAVVNGTCALHLCMLVQGVERGDYVIIPNLTFVATANAVNYTGAEPILMDIDPETWQMDLGLLEKFLDEETEQLAGNCIYKKNGRRIRVLMPVHVLGNMCDMDRLMEIAGRHNLIVIEDSTEALGSSYRGKPAGTYGVMNCFSFNGNKIISTGGGGVIVTDDEALAKLTKHLTTQAKPNPTSYEHDMIGYNYRLVNVLAAIGVAQMEQLDGFIERKQEIMDIYRRELTGVGDIGFQKIPDGVKSNGWLFTISSAEQAALLDKLNARKMISRAFWVPMNQLPMFGDLIYYNEADQCDNVFRTCLSIPSSTDISDEDVLAVCEVIKEHFK